MLFEYSEKSLVLFQILINLKNSLYMFKAGSVLCFTSCTQPCKIVFAKVWIWFFCLIAFFPRWIKLEGEPWARNYKHWLFKANFIQEAITLFSTFTHLVLYLMHSYKSQVGVDIPVILIIKEICSSFHSLIV